MRFIIVIILVIVVISNEINCQYMRRRSKMNNNNNISSSNNIPITTVSLNKNELNNDLTTTTTTEEYIASVTETISTMPSIKNNSTVVQSKISGLPSVSASVGTPTQSNTTSTSLNMNLLPLPPGASAVLVKPTKYHYYPHNQHIYLLPECAIQQVCNAVYVRLNWTQPLCACPSRYRDPCSASLNSDDLHTTKLITGSTPQSALTLVKTCEPVADMRLCRSPRDWSLLALQNIRTGKSHYLVICRCPESSILEGPMSHDQPTYASVPGIRVYGMMCVQDKLRNTISRTEKSLSLPSLPWKKIIEVYRTAKWD